MKWIKTSDRLPSREAVYYTLLENQTKSTNTFYTKTGFKKGIYFESDVILWLDESEKDEQTDEVIEVHLNKKATKWVKSIKKTPDEPGNFNVKHKDGELTRQYFNGTGFINFDTSTWNYFSDIIEWEEESEANEYLDIWVPIEEGMPERNKGVLVFIPQEDNHITSGMWDIENKWVLLDEYRIVGEGDGMEESMVTHWMPLPSCPNV